MLAFIATDFIWCQASVASLPVTQLDQVIFNMSVLVNINVNSHSFISRHIKKAIS